VSRAEVKRQAQVSGRPIAAEVWQTVPEQKKASFSVEKPPLQFPNPTEDRNRLTGTVAASAKWPEANGKRPSVAWAIQTRRSGVSY
jgi:hypothetical protein